jgi:hypothetical protein
MESDQRQFLANAWPLIAVVLMASGVLVQTVPLESKRPIDPDRVKFARAGRQDIEARLWQDPFIAMRHVKGQGPMERCKEAINDQAHHPSTLQKALLRSSRSGRLVTVLPVMVSGGPYFEDGEGRRRSRYAVVTALLNSGWKPSDEDKLGYVWTFESCVVHWERRAPELLPYEWFRTADQDQQNPRALLVLWVDEDALTRGPLEGIERIIELLVQGSHQCPSSDDDRLYGNDEELLEKLETVCVPKKTQGWQIAGCPWSAQSQRLPLLPGCDIRVIGPSTSSSLKGLAQDLGQDLGRGLTWSLAWSLAWDFAQQRAISISNADLLAMPGERSAGDFARQRATPDPAWLRFYSSGATMPVSELNFRNISHNTQSNYYKNIDRRVEDFQNVLSHVLDHSFQFFGVMVPFTASDLQELGKSFRNRVIHDKLPEAFINEKNLREGFENRVIKLTTTDDQLTKAFIEELMLRLVDPKPWLRIFPRLNLKGTPLCGDTVVVISEGDTKYARSFLAGFKEDLEKPGFLECDSQEPRLHPVHYLRGLDGVLPEGTGTPALSASPPREPARTNTDAVFEQATLERADGPSQYDYLRRLATYLVDLDRREKKEGRNGVRAVGVLGNDVYDKILVLDALRDRFPRAVFFAADLDARLFGRQALRSTRNLIVASSYGLTLNPRIQGAVSPFRDTYQSGIYLSTLVALNHVVPPPPPADVSSWFAAPQLFEIGRTRAVPLSRGSAKDCKTLDLEPCMNIHALDEQPAFNPWPDPTLVLLLFFIVATAVVLGLLLLSGHARRVVITVVVVTVMLLVVLVVWRWIIWPEVISGKGEPFAWFEGVSIWPTKIFELLILLVTVGLLFYGRWQLRCDIDTVAEKFNLTRLSKHESATTPRAQGERGFWPWVRWHWWLDRTGTNSSSNGTQASPWLEFLDRMRWRPSFKRVLVMTVLYFVFGIALISLDWPFSPHRGWVSAWFNHILMLALLLGMMALLMTVLDVSEMTRRYFTHLGPRTLPQGEEPTDKELERRYPVGKDAIRLWTRFRFAVELASRVNRFIWLPFITLSLALPIRNRVFDAWDIPLPYIALLGVSVVLAVRGALSLRHAAAELRTQILALLLTQLDHLELTAKLVSHGRSTETDATPTPVAVSELRDVPSGGATAAARVDIPAAVSDNESTAAPDDLPLQIKADLLRRIADEIRLVQEGPFRPWTQEPVVRALLIVSGWAGGISTIEFLFLK